MPERKTLVLLVGPSGSGKSALGRCIASDATYLLPSPLSQVASGAGYFYIGKELFESVTLAGDVEATAEGLIGEYDYLVTEPWHTWSTIAQKLVSTYELIVCVIVTPLWMIIPRQVERVIKIDYFIEQLRTALKELNDLDFGSYYAEIERQVPDGANLLWVDGRDMPYRLLGSAEEALAVVTAEQFDPCLADAPPRFQQGFCVRGQWWGDRIPFEQARVNAILGLRVEGDVLDVGAANGGMCIAALSRGATTATALDFADSFIADVRHLRDAWQLPLSTLHLDISKYDIPMPATCDYPTRYHQALLLNVLHRVENPAEVLARVLNVSDRAVIECPYCAVGFDHEKKQLEEAVPIKPSWAAYPGTWHFPLVWLQQQAANSGFEVASIRLGPYCPQQRIICEVRRETKQQ